MQKCIHCQGVDGVVKAGFLRGKQRFYCKNCEQHFTLMQQEGKKQSKNQAPTIIDVAKALGVAPSTVSRALNDKPEISAETRNAILQKAFELDYKPNLLAQSLHRGQTHTIGVIIPNIERPFFAGVLAGIQHVVSQAGYRVMICQSNESHQTEVLNVQALVASRVDGLLISHSKETFVFEHIRLPLSRGLPIVHFDRVCNELPTPKITQEDYRGSFELVQHLIERGYRRIATLTGPDTLLISQNRLAGYKAALQQYGLAQEDQLIFRGNFRKEDSLNALNYWLNLPNPPDAIFAVFYQNAIEMMVETKKRGIAIPDQLGFVGFGDELIAELINPSLTVFHLFPFKVGEAAARLLIEQIVHKDSFIPNSQQVQGQLIVRQSSLRAGV